MSESTSLTKLEGLKRRIDISVPAEDVDQAYQKKMQTVARTVKLPGFRPGKVPQKVVEQKFSKSILAEIAQELVQSHFVKEAEALDLKIVGRPEVNPKEIQPGKPFEFSAEFEIYPEITLAEMPQLKITRSVLELKDEDVDNMLETLQKQHAQWVEVDRPAEKGDQIELDFEGYVDGKVFDKGVAQNFKLELGSQRMIPGFEESLVGYKANEEGEITCDFPENYSSADLAGKKATFKVKIHHVSEAKLPEIDEEFAKRVGVQSVDELRKEVEKNMRAQVQQLLKDKVKLQVMDKLFELNQIELPDALIDAEIGHLRNMMKQKIGEAAKQMSDDMLPRNHFEEQARRRVSLGLLLGELIAKHDLKVDAQKVRERIEQIASVYHDPQQVINWYYNNKQMLSEVESVVIEDQAVDKILEECQIEDKPVSYQEAIKSAQDNGLTSKDE